MAFIFHHSARLLSNRFEQSLYSVERAHTTKFEWKIINIRIGNDSSWRLVDRLAASIASSVVGVDKRLANPMSAALLVSEGVRLGGWIAPFDLRVRRESSTTSHVLSVCSISQHWWPQQHNGPAWGGLLSQYSFFGLWRRRTFLGRVLKRLSKGHRCKRRIIGRPARLLNLFMHML